MPCSIHEMLETFPDSRNPSVKRYPLASIRAFVIAATLAGRTSPRAIAR